VEGRQLGVEFAFPLQRTTYEISIPQGNEHDDYDITGSLMDRNQLFGRTFCLHLQGGSGFFRNFGIYIPR
jgi:hypothetical protein